MKSFCKMLCRWQFPLYLCLLLCFTVGANAYSGQMFSHLPFDRYEGFSTVITDTEGVLHRYDAVLRVSALEETQQLAMIDSYALEYEGETVLSVSLRDILPAVELRSTSGNAASKTLNGYYAVTFTVDDEHEAFLTGLSQNAMGQVQDELVSSKLFDRTFKMTNLSFIDAEKQYYYDYDDTEDSDEELCWAAATSNILWYTGWGKQAIPEAESCDDIFDIFTERFSDRGGDILFGLQWFFNGYNAAHDWEDWSVVDDGTYGSFTGYLPEYCADAISRRIEATRQAGSLRSAFDALKEGAGVAMAVGWYRSSGSRNGGHAITLWGYVRDTSYLDRCDPDAYTAMLISDSDSDVTYGNNRRTAPNVIRLLPLGKYNNQLWKVGYYSDGSSTTGVLEDFVVLEPYSSSISTESTGNRNKLTTADLLCSEIYFYNTNSSTVYRRHFTTDESVSYGFHVENYGGQDLTLKFRQSCTVSYSLTREGAAAPVSKSSYNFSELPPGYYIAETVNVGKLPMGKYTLTVTVNSTNTAPEAYYSNNIYSDTFWVLGSNAAVDDTKTTVSFSALTEGSYQVAAYDADGKLTGISAGTMSEYDTQQVELAVGRSDVALVKVFQMQDGSWIPLCEPLRFEFS